MSSRAFPLVRSLLLAAAVAAVAGQASAQANANQPTTTTGTIFQPILLAKNSDLSFGTVVRPTNGTGTVSIAASNGQRALTGAGALLNSGPNAPPSRATYTITGEGGQSFSVTTPPNFSMTRTGGSETILVTLTPTITSGQLSGSLGGAGTTAFGVGGSLAISNNTPSGAYVGTFNVVVAYN